MLVICLRVGRCGVVMCAMNMFASRSVMKVSMVCHVGVGRCGVVLLSRGISCSGLCVHVIPCILVAR